ncbi:MAG: metal-dependent hydrolase [Anaerolineales bacterium]|nr:metal-dependent hydrolase [Anaerolineales bacterium]
MAQAGIHALAGAAARKVVPRREWLLLGIILGNVFPDLDNYAVAVATLGGLNTHGLHRTFTHSLLAILAAMAVFFVVAQVRRQPRWTNLGVGFGVGIGMHIILDLLIWFNGVELLWPWDGWVNLWEGVEPPAWFATLLDPAELLFIVLYLVWLAKAARDHHTNADFLATLRLWIIALVVLFIIFTPLAYLMSRGFLTVFGVAYLISITAAFIITIRMRQTIEA